MDVIFREILMNIKKLSLVVSAAFAGALTMGSAFAATTESVGGGKITFSGAVSDATCNVTTNNGSDFTVNLAPIALTDLSNTAGVVTAGSTPFTMAVSGCTGFDATSTVAQQLKMKVSGANVSDDSTYLKNETGTASGVGITLTTDGSTAVDLANYISTGLSTSATTTDGTAGAVFDNGAEGDITLYANYYNYGGASASVGTVVTTATYMFTYE